MSIFDTCLAAVLHWEGGYVDDPRDPGGETRFGISRRAYPDVDIATLTAEQAGAIYHRDYWQVCQCDALPPALAMLVFDGAVNQGTGAAIRMLQAAAKVPEDGAMGPRTIAAARSPAVVDAFAVQRALRYATTRGMDVYGKGWFNRLFDMHRRAVGLGGG